MDAIATINQIIWHFNASARRDRGILSQMKSKFELLRKREILDILDGDSGFGSLKIEGKDSEIIISMPYLSGPNICDISNSFGLEVIYGRCGGAKSRRTFFDDLLTHCIRNKSVSDLLSFLFSKEQFVDKFKGKSRDIIDYAYSHIVRIVIEQINSILYLTDNELVKNEDLFDIRKIRTAVPLSTPSLKSVDRNYVNDLSNRVLKDLSRGDYDSAVTKARTLLEEVFCYVIEKRGGIPSESGNISKLYIQVKQLYNMCQSEDLDKRINGLLSGLEKILTAITEMRNKAGDSHGVGTRRINISEHHTRLFVNSAMVMADFILAVYENASR